MVTLPVFLTLCVSFAACGLSSGGNEKADFSALYIHLENEDYVAAMEMLAKIQRGTSGAEPGIDSDTAQKYAVKYDQLDADLQNQLYANAAKRIAKMAFDHYQRMAEGNAPAWNQIEAGWPEKVGNPGFDKRSFVYFYEDGRFGWTRNDQELWWIIREYTPTQLEIEVFYTDTLESAGFIRIDTEEKTLGFVLQERNNGGSSELNCVRNWLRTDAYDGQWQTPERNEFFPASLTLEGSSVIIDDVRYPMTFAEDEAYIYGEDGALLYTIMLCMNDSFDYVELWNDWTRCEYYLPAQYEHMLMVSEYEKALEILPMLKDNEYGLDYNGDERNRQEWLAYIYQTMVNAKGYGESAQILANFSQLENMLVGITTVPEEFNYYMENYKYDAAGRLIYAYDESLTLFIYGTPDLTLPVAGAVDYYEDVSDQYYFAYDLRGRISRILHKNGNDLVATITPAYDTRGNIKCLDIQLANGETRVTNFTYDSDLMPRSVGSDMFLPDTDVLRTISCGDYFLDFAWTPDPDGYILSGIVGWISYHLQDASYTEEYTYENGRMTRRFITITSDDGSGGIVNTEEYLYTYDGEGKIASEQCTITSGDNSWVDTLYYVYRDVFFYDFTA